MPKTLDDICKILEKEPGDLFLINELSTETELGKEYNKKIKSFYKKFGRGIESIYLDKKNKGNIILCFSEEKYAQKSEEKFYKNSKKTSSTGNVGFALRDGSIVTYPHHSLYKEMYEAKKEFEKEKTPSEPSVNKDDNSSKSSSPRYSKRPPRKTVISTDNNDDLGVAINPPSPNTPRRREAASFSSLTPPQSKKEIPTIPDPDGVKRSPKNRKRVDRKTTTGDPIKLLGPRGLSKKFDEYTKSLESSENPSSTNEQEMSNSKELDDKDDGVHRKTTSSETSSKTPSPETKRPHNRATVAAPIKPKPEPKENPKIIQRSNSFSSSDRITSSFLERLGLGKRQSPETPRSATLQRKPSPKEHTDFTTFSKSPKEKHRH